MSCIHFVTFDDEEDKTSFKQQLLELGEDWLNGVFFATLDEGIAEKMGGEHCLVFVIRQGISNRNFQLNMVSLGNVFDVDFRVSQSSCYEGSIVEGSIVEGIK